MNSKFLYFFGYRNCFKIIANRESVREVIMLYGSKMSIIFVNIITPPYLELTTKGMHSSVVNSVPAIPHHMPWSSGGLGCVHSHCELLYNSN